MQTQCPKCNAIFGVLPKQLRIANGLVRCSQCHAVFNGREQVSFLKPEELESITRKALDNLRKSTPTQDADQIQSLNIDQGNEISAHADDKITPAIKAPERGDAPPSPGVSKANLQPEQQHVPAVLMSDFTAPRGHHKSGWKSWFAAGLASLILLALLGGQYVYFNWWELSRNPQLYPGLQWLCEIGGCELAPLRNVEQIELVSRNVYSHPNEAEALMITATMENKAIFAQPYPALRISFTNQQEKVIARREFSPNEYLPQGEDANVLMPSGQTVNLILEVVDPGKDAFGYEFHFF